MNPQRGILVLVGAAAAAALWFAPDSRVHTLDPDDAVCSSLTKAEKGDRAGTAAARAPSSPTVSDPRRALSVLPGGALLPLRMRGAAETLPDIIVSLYQAEYYSPLVFHAFRSRAPPAA